MRLLLAGVSTRAMADSAARAGFEVTAIDAFADLDQHPSVHALSLGERFSAAAAARAAQAIAADALAYGANFENHPEAVDRIAEGRVLWGNHRDVLRRVRDPELLSDTLRRRGFAAPRVLRQPPIADHHSPQSPIPNPQPPIPNPQPPARWLLKRCASGGGHGVREWREGQAVPAGSFLQERIDGEPCSIVFVAAGGRAVPLGFCRQLIGDAAFGSSGYRYCGNILTAAPEDGEALAAACAIAAAVAEEFALVGVNGIDLIVEDGVPYAIEVNPRWCASMDLVEREYGLSVFGIHAAACRDGALPDVDLASLRGHARTSGKAVVFARHDVVASGTADWLSARDDESCHRRDVPKPGTRIAAGQPVCTVYAEGRDAADCRAELVHRAERVYTALNAML